MDREDIYLSLDRLTRFKNPEIKYRRVFYDIILKHLVQPSLSKHKLDEQPADFLAEVTEKIWNASVENIFGKKSNKNISLKEYDAVQYIINDDYTSVLMNADLNISDILEEDLPENSPSNLLFLKKFYDNYDSSSDFQQLGVDIRTQFSTLFPISKVILTEGITEEILIPKFASVSGYDFDTNGVYILPTGGKSKVLSIYADLKYSLKIPVFVLLDNDAKPVYDDVMSVLRDTDIAYLIKSGEFEDILPKDILQDAFSEMNYDVSPASTFELSSEYGTCYALENLWKSRGLGEFRKAHFAKAVKDCIKDDSCITYEISAILDMIKLL